MSDIELQHNDTKEIAPTSGDTATSKLTALQDQLVDELHDMTMSPSWERVQGAINSLLESDNKREQATGVRLAAAVTDVRTRMVQAVNQMNSRLSDEIMKEAARRGSTGLTTQEVVRIIHERTIRMQSQPISTEAKGGESEQLEQSNQPPTLPKRP